MDVEKYQKFPLSSFLGIVRLFFTKSSSLKLFDDLRQMKNVKAFPWRANPVQLLGFWGALEETTLTL